MGICHFIEHALFKGTATRSALEIAQAMDAIGGHLNAFTDKEHTCYYLRVLSNHLDDAMDVLADMLLHPAFEPEALERERQVILEEIHMYEDAPDDLVHDLFASSMWPEHPLGWPIAGIHETVARLSRADSMGFMGAYCRPNVSLLAAAGRLSHDAIVELAERALGAWDGRSVPTAASRRRSRGRRWRFGTRTSSRCTCVSASRGFPRRTATGTRSPSWTRSSAAGCRSRLFQEIREERGLAYSISTYHAAYRDAGAFVVYAGTSPASAREVVHLVLENLARARDGLDAAEIARAKESLKGSLMLDLETPGSRMSKLARSEQYFGRQLSLDEIIGARRRRRRATTYGASRARCSCRTG